MALGIALRVQGQLQAKSKMSQSRLILSNAVIIWISRVLLLLPQLIMVPFLIGTIGEAGYGVYALVWSLMISVEQIQVSLQQGVVKYCAGLFAQGRIDEVNRVVSSGFVYSSLLAVLACAATIATAPFYNGSSGHLAPALAVVSVMLLLIFPLTPYIAVIQSRQRYFVGAITETVSKYLSFFAVVMWFYVVGPSVEALIMIMAGMLFLARLAQLPIAYRLVPGLHNRLSLCNREHLRLIASFGSATVLIGLCLMANSAGIRWLMASLASTSFVAHLAIVLMPSAMLSQIVMAVTVTVMPATSAYQATGNQRLLQELLVRSMRYTFILSLAGLLAAAFLIRNILDIWVGAGYTFLAPHALVLFATTSFALSTSPAHHMLKGLGWLRIAVCVSVFALVVAPIGLILAVFHIWHDSYLAATAGLVTGNIAYACLQVLFASKAVDAKVRDVFMHVYARPVFVCAVVWLAVLGIVANTGFDDVIARFILSVLAVLLFLGGCYAFAATAAERQQIGCFISKALNRAPAIRAMLPVQSQSKQ